MNITYIDENAYFPLPAQELAMNKQASDNQRVIKISSLPKIEISCVIPVYDMTLTAVAA